MRLPGERHNVGSINTLLGVTPISCREIDHLDSRNTLLLNLPKEDCVTVCYFCDFVCCLNMKEVLLDPDEDADDVDMM